MASCDEETLESLLTKATNPLKSEVNWSMVTLFCERVKRDGHLAPNAIRLLAHKIQSPVEREALYSLLTLEECAKVCGPAFHTELGKFRFLNEMIKIVSPKYLGNQTSEEIKDKCIEIMYNWTRELRKEAKIIEAYDMLKKQGIVKSDPLTHDQKFPERKPDLLFKDEQSSKTLEMLLKSKHPDDLQAANRLIKLMVKQDIESTEKKSVRQSKLEIVNNNVEVLNEMMEYHRKNSSRETENDVMLELYHNLENERPKLFRMASEFESTEQISDILETSDRVVMAMNDYKSLFPKTAASSSSSSSQPLPSHSPQPVTHQLLEFPVSPSASSTNAITKTTYEELGDIFNNKCEVITDSKSDTTDTKCSLILGLNMNVSNSSSLLSPSGDVDSLLDNDIASILTPDFSSDIMMTSMVSAIPPPATLMGHQNNGSSSRYSLLQGDATSMNDQGRVLQSSAITTTTLEKKNTYKEALAKLDQLGQDMIQKSLSKNQEPKISETRSLSDIFVPIETIDPDSKEPLRLFDAECGFNIHLYYSLNYPREDVKVYAFCMTSKCRTDSIESVTFSVKSTKAKYQLVKLQPPNQNRIPAFNPILPPQAISQVMLLANPQKEAVKLDFSLTYFLKGKEIKENGHFNLPL